MKVRKPFLFFYQFHKNGFGAMTDLQWDLEPLALIVLSVWSTDGNVMEHIGKRLRRLYLIALHLPHGVAS
jgi:hypothetical protein